MPTIYQRLQRYYSRPNTAPISNKKKKKIYNKVKRIFDGHPDKNTEPLTYTESIEGDHVFEVRNYPDSFVRIIDAVIINAATSTPISPQVKKKERKKIPAKPKPIYSTRNTLK